jgi:hypothetical protein
VSLRRIDARFLLPEQPSTAVVLGGLDAWREGLGEAGVETPGAGEVPDLAVAAASDAQALVSSGARMVVAEGPGAARVLRRAGYAVRRWIPVGGTERPDMLLPLDQPAAARYALERWMLPDTRVKRLRNKGLAELVTRGVWPRPAPVIVIGSLHASPPALLRSAEETLGIGADEMFVSLGGSDDLARGAAHLFRRGIDAPEWVLKFGRVRGYARPFDLDEAGLTLAAQVGGRVAAHAPRLVGRFRLGELEASVETAARGERMVNFLKASGSRESKLAAIESVAAWILDVARETSASSDELGAERARLRAEVIPAWAGVGADDALLDAVAGVPAVFRRGDLGAWNIVVDLDGFTAVDWETAQRHGFPLWDLLYFLVDALAHLDGAWEDDARDAFTRALFRGEGRSSHVLFDWVRRAAHASAVPDDAVGPIATLCWMSVGLAHVRRGAAAQAVRPGAEVRVPPVERIAPLWMADSALGPSWDRWKH